VSILPELREWQGQASQKWKDNNFKGIVEVATAGGKTRFALECVKFYLENVKYPKIVIITPTTALADQWAVSLMTDLNISKEDICVWPDEKEVEKKFHVMVINTARIQLPKLVKSNDDIFVIADEVHRYGSEENSKSFKEKFKFAVGLTATAQREFDDGLEQKLIPSFGPIIFQYSIINARKDEIIAPFELVNIEVPFQKDEQTEYDKLSSLIARSLSQKNEERAKILAMRRASVSKNAINKIPAAIALVQRESQQKILVFHESIKSAENIYEQLKTLGYRVGIYHSEIYGPVRRDFLKQYKEGYINILISCRALDEGVDIPDANVAIIVASTSSLRQRVQRLGRVIRKHPSKEFATIYTFYSTPKESNALIEEMKNLESITRTTWQKMSFSNE
jgi:superfamily II DNA or RNA helicase